MRSQERLPVTRPTQVNRCVIAAWVAAVLFASSCATVATRNPLPAELSGQAQVLGVAYARSWGDATSPQLEDWFSLTDDEHATYPAYFKTRHNYLALSGGGANGAFAAGLLVGWTAAGDRPEFTIVTGISAGALIAPFAFLGPDYDQVLEDVATTIRTEDVLRKRRTIRALRTDALSGSKPLRELLAKYVDETVMEGIAEEFRRGRDLWIGTTDLDSMRPVSWSIGEIADSEHPGALALIRQVLLASASIPAIMPPVLIEVEADGEKYDEIHVDGGAASQVFLYPASVDWERVVRAAKAQGKPRVYVIRNSRLDPKWKATENKLFPLADRSIATLIRTQGIGDLYRIYDKAVDDGLDFNLAYIPSDFDEVPTEMFDPVYTTKLFNRAYEMAKNGNPWHKMPPELRTE